MRRRALSIAALAGLCIFGASATTVATAAKKPTRKATTKTAKKAAPTTTAAKAPTTTKASAPVSTASCPTKNFPDLSGSAGAGAGFAKPSISVTCTASELVAKSNGMISYPFVKKTPNELGSQDYTWRVPLNPVKATSATSIVNRLGTLGFTVTGVPFYGPTEGPQPAAEAFGDPVANGLLDGCGGHTGPNRDYHYHTIVFGEAVCNFTSSQIVGYAIDGFPVYNSVLCLDKACKTTTPARSGFTVTGSVKAQVWNAVRYTGGPDAGTATSATLDACNGRVEPDGSYAYHVTVTQFPYIIGCLAGTATAQAGNAGAAMPPMANMGGAGSPPPPPPKG